MEERYADFLDRHKEQKETLKKEKENMDNLMLEYMEQMGVCELTIPRNKKIKINKKKTITTHK